MLKINDIKKWIKANWLSIVITIVYFLFHFYLILHHEAWRDESQAWVIAKNTTLLELFADLCVEGHPCLWFLLIRPFAKLGFSFFAFSTISLCLMTIACFLFLLKCKLVWITKVFILFSSLFLYINPVICRTYSLIILLVVLLAIIWKKRYEKPILYGVIAALIFQTHVMMSGFAIGLLVDMFIEMLNKSNKKTYIPFVMTLTSLIAMMFELFQRKNMPNTIHVSAGGILSKININNISVALNNIRIQLWGIDITSAIILLAAILIIFIIFVIRIIKNKNFKTYFREIIIFCFGIGAYLVIACFVYPNQHKQMLTCAVAMFLFFSWISFEKTSDKINSILLTLLVSLMCVFTIVPAISIMKYDLKGCISTSKYMASYIINEVEEDSVILTSQIDKITPVYSYVSSKRNDLPFWSVDTKDYYKIHVWGDGLYTPHSIDELKEIANMYFPNKTVYYLCDYDKDGDGNNAVYYIDEYSYYLESYWLYKLK